MNKLLLAVVALATLAVACGGGGIPPNGDPNNDPPCTQPSCASNRPPVNPALGGTWHGTEVLETSTVFAELPMTITVVPTGTHAQVTVICPDGSPAFGTNERPAVIEGLGRLSDSNTIEWGLDVFCVMSTDACNKITVWSFLGSLTLNEDGTVSGKGYGSVNDCSSTVEYNWTFTGRK